MARTHRYLTTAVLVVSLIGTSWTPLFASDGVPASPARATEPLSSLPSPSHRSPFLLSDESLLQGLGPSDARQWGRHGGHHGRGGHNDGSQTAIILGSIAAIAGTAVLVYANRPECNAFPSAGGCGYGTKVVGGAVLAGGITSLVIGAATWH